MMERMAESTNSGKEPSRFADEWDAGDMGCGELLIHLSMKMKRLKPGELFKLTANDEGAIEDMPAWSRLTGHPLVDAAHPLYILQRKNN
jgi:tRNA 2-thiouridine synthesizing protein A